MVGSTCHVFGKMIKVYSEGVIRMVARADVCQVQNGKQTNKKIKTHKET